MKTFNTKEAFLLDALEYYTADTNRRCQDPSVRSCQYSPVNAGKSGISEGCMIGRYLTPENQLIADDVEGDTDIKSVIGDRPDIIPQWMQDLGISFLSDCQALHDTDNYWDENGFTEAGKFFLGRIIYQNSLDKSQFEKYIL